MSASYNDNGRLPTEVVATPAAAVGGAALSRVSWSAIFAGIVLVLAVEVLLNVLGAGVGLGLVNPGSSGTPSATSFGMGAGIWWLVSSIIALVFGCYVAARLAGVASRWDGVLHGLVIWGGAVLITVYLLTSTIGGVIGGAFSVLGTTVSAAGSVASGTASAAGSAAKAMLPQIEQDTGITPNVLQQQAETILQSPTPQNPASMSRPNAVKAIAQALPELLSGGSKGAAAQKRITDIVAAQAQITPQDAQKRVADAQTRLTNLKKQAVQTAKQTADASAAAASRAAFLAFVALLIGAVAAGIGGALASPRPPFLARWVVRSQGEV